MKSKQFENLLYSTVGIIALLALLVIVNFIATRSRVRADMTAEKAYTLSAGTKAIIAKLDTPVKIRFYYTQGENAMPVVLKNYAQEVEDLLAEYKNVSRGKILVEKYNPQPDSDAEDSAKLDGVEGQMVSPASGEKVYLGLVISQLDEKVALPFLSLDREKLLEYDLSRAISKVSHPEKPVIGIMSGMPIFGAPANPMMARMGQGGQGQEPWVFVSELKNDFTVKEVQLNADKIDDDVKVLVVVHPKDVSDATQYAIDQFILKGGKLLAFVDPNAFFDKSGQQNQMFQMPAAGSSLDKLFKAWGVGFDTAKIVADMTFSTPMQQGTSPTVLSVTPDGINTNDVVTGQIDSLLVPYAGVFTGTPVGGLKQTVLLHTSKSSQLVDRMMGQMASEQTMNEFKASGSEYPLAIRLSGKFKTAFPDGKPKDKPEEKPGETNKVEISQSAGLKESATENTVILVGDADMLNDAVCVQIQNFFGQRVVIPRGGNLNFVQGAVEQLTGDSNLISVRSRGSLNRPFTRVKKMEAQAEESYRAQIGRLEKDLQDTQQRLGELQQNKDKGQKFILSPEQQKEMDNFRKKQAETNKELKKLRKDLRQDINALENTLKWINILGMPFLVAVSGIVIAVYKRKRTAAR
ncbi:MAG: putative transporter, rane protein [Verrucomicrobiales bacterium]|nr:putative transporter, rane protein [Verrucomicrobiales bacterium]